MNSSKLRPMALAAATMWLAGCATAPSSISACPKIVEYPRPFMIEAAAELERIPAGSALDRMMQDYAVLRAQLRACQ